MGNDSGLWLWHLASILMTLLTVLLGYYVSVWFAGLFWIVAILILLALRPE